MSAVPRLETERLILRGHEAHDLNDVAALWSEPDTVRFTSGAPLSREESWRRMAFYRGMWELAGFGYFAVFEKDAGSYIGDAGMLEAQRAIELSLVGTMEAGWIFKAEAQGKGFAREAMRAVLDWCAAAHPDLPVTCVISPDNTPSLRLADTLGFRQFARTVYKDAETLVFRLER